MTKNIIAIIAGLVLLGGGYWAYTALSGGNGAVNEEETVADTPLDATYIIDGEEIRLSAGQAEREGVSVSGNVWYGDLTNDGKEDAVLILAREQGADSVYYLASAETVGTKFRGTNAILLGSGATLKNIEFTNNTAIVSYSIPGGDEDMVSESKVVTIENGTLVETMGDAE